VIKVGYSINQTLDEAVARFAFWIANQESMGSRKSATEYELSKMRDLMNETMRIRDDYKEMMQEFRERKDAKKMEVIS
jgi:hypothetical protein